LKESRIRDGTFSPRLFKRYQRNEKALLTSMLEVNISAVSTCKVSDVVKRLCGTFVSKSLVSNLTVELDPMVNEWRNHSLSGTKFLCVVTDVLYIKVREAGRVISKNCHIAIGISEDGSREIISFRF